MKRQFDIVTGLVTLVVFGIPLIIIGLLVAIKFGRPIIFKQVRPGRNGILFKLYKFRTMTNEKDRNGELLPDQERMTRFGALLRSTSLDELPSLFNVIKGDISFVGPRPLLVEYLPLYSAEQSRRHEVKPGLTGWAQVNGRNGISWECKFKLDVWYVDNQSFLLDVKILLLTVKKVLMRHGIAAEGEATMSKFKGTNNE